MTSGVRIRIKDSLWGTPPACGTSTQPASGHTLVRRWEVHTKQLLGAGNPQSHPQGVWAFTTLGGLVPLLAAPSCSWLWVSPIDAGCQP